MELLLRDIVDLEATYDMSDISDSKLEDTLKLIGVVEMVKIKMMTIKEEYRKR